MSIEKQDKQVNPNTKTRDEKIADAVLRAVKSTEGVHSLSGGKANIFTKNFAAKSSLPGGIKISSTDEGLVLDISIAVKYGSSIPALCWDLQKNIKKEILLSLEAEISAVNIHVRSVRFPDEGAGGNTNDTK